MMAAAGTCWSRVVPAGPGSQHHGQWAQALAPAVDDVLGHLVDQRDVAGKPLDDGQVDALEVLRDQRPDFFELHSRDKPPGFPMNQQWYPSAVGVGMAQGP